MSRFTDLLKDQVAQKRFLAVLEPFDPVSGTVKPIYLSSHGFTSKPSDTPASRHYAPRLKQAYSFKRALFSQGKVSGRTVPGYGEIRIANDDGGLDHLATYAWGGRRIRVWLGGKDFALSEYGQIFEGTAQGLSWGDNEITVNLRSLEFMFDREIQTEVFTTGATEILNKRKPRAYGIARQAEPIYMGIVGGKHTFAVGDSKGITAIRGVWDKGIALTFNPGTPAAGEYTYDKAASTLTLGGSFEGPILVDLIGRPMVTYSASNSVTAGLGAKVFTVPAGLSLKRGLTLFISTDANNWMIGYVEAYSGTSLTVTVTENRNTLTSSAWKLTPFGTPALLMRAFAEDMGVTSFDAAAFAAREAFFAPPAYTAVFDAAGYWIPEGGNGLEVMDALADGSSSFWGFNRAGQLSVGALGIIGGSAGDGASPVPTVSFGPREILSINRQATDEPNWSVTTRSIRKWRVLTTNELAGAAVYARFLNEWEDDVQKDTAILTAYPLSEALTVETVYDSPRAYLGPSTLVNFETRRLFQMFSVRRDYFSVDLKAQPLTLDLGQTVAITHPRYGLSGGKSLFIVDVDEVMNGDTCRVSLGLWG